jgi:SOS-response transcriptional repressor LexA
MSAALKQSIQVLPVSIPATVAHFEMFDNSLAGAGVLQGDTAVILLDCDIQSRDFVLAHVLGEGLRVLQYHSAPSERVKLRTLEYQKSRKWALKRENVVIFGRVVQFQCNGKPVQTVVEIRPVC